MRTTIAYMPRNNRTPTPRSPRKRQSTTAHRVRVGSQTRSFLTPAATNLFEVPEPVQIGHRVYDNNHIHRSRRGELRISKSEVIIANELAV